MLTIAVKVGEDFDDDKQEFIPRIVTLQMEHSLFSLSKWEFKFEKPFLNTETEKTPEEVFEYVKMMTLTPEVPDWVYGHLTKENFEEINEYINARASATWFHEIENKKESGEKITAEIIYYWMLSLNVWLDWEHRHLNSLLTLIKTINIKNAPPRKMSVAEAQAKQRALNQARKEKYNTRG